VQKFVFASSSFVYRGSTSTYFSEDEVVDNPVSPYPASKKACELLAYKYHHLYNLLKSSSLVMVAAVEITYTVMTLWTVW
jgi:nucleoside-diphosphate-sugar epimerase